MIEAAGGKEAIQFARGYGDPIHLLLTAVVMPGMNGRVLAEALVAERPELRVLYMSGYTDDVIAHRGILEPSTMLLEKPFGARATFRTCRWASPRDRSHPSSC